MIFSRHPAQRPLLALLIAGPSAFAQAPAPSSAPEAAATAASAASAAAPGDDPYLWLEKVDSPEAMAWVRDENQKTLSVLEKDPHFEAFHRDALAVAQTPERIPVPSQIDGRLYNFWQDASHVRGLWRVTSTDDYAPGATPRWKAVLDLDKLAAAEHANWVWSGADCVAQRPQRCLLRLSDGGEDAVTLREFDLRKSAFVAGGFVLPKGKQSVAWETPDMLAVAREWKPGEMTTSGYAYVVKRLRRAQPLSAATEIFRGQPSDVGVEPKALSDSSGHRALVLVREVTTFETEHYLVTPAGAKKLALPLRASVQELFDGQLVVRIEQDWDVDGRTVAKGTLVSFDLAQATAHPEALHPAIVFAPNERQTVDAVSATRDGLVVASLDNVRGRAALYRHGRDGRWTATPLTLPDNATISIVSTDQRSPTAYLWVAGFLQPSSLWRADDETASVAQVRALPPQFDASKDVVEQYEAASSDGVKVPYFIVHPKDMPLDGSHPTILYAYGGFDVSLSPWYSATTGKLWLERGGVYVVANIRGGGEFGPAWHDAGLKTKRQIVYDDFAAVARDLIARKVTSPRRLGIMGGSNGGLLMGVEMTQHPELWNAVDIQVPLLDMLRYEQIAAGSSWVGEYGSVSVPEERAFLAKISPYQNLRRDVKYPPALVWTTTKDDRVGPQHARKFAARLAEYGIPYEYYEVIEGGHGSGANQKERAHTSALEFTYFTRQLVD